MISLYQLLKDGYRLIRQDDDGWCHLLKEYPAGEKHYRSILDLTLVNSASKVSRPIAKIEKV